jgi:heme exporter protein A
MITAKGLSKKFGRRYVLKDLNFSISSGEIVALVGENGSGKTTLLRLIAGQIKPSNGEIFVHEKEPWKDCNIRKKIGFITHKSYFYGDLTAEENLKFYSKSFGKMSVEVALEIVGLKKFKDVRISKFSKGMIQRLCISRILLQDPDILLLDEPTSGLDFKAKKQFFELIETEFKNKTIIIASHSKEEVGICEKAYYLSDKKMDERRIDEVLKKVF